MTPQSMKICFKYNEFAAVQMWKYISQLDDSQLAQHTPCLQTSVRDYVIEIINLKRYWGQLIAGFTPESPLIASSFHSFDTVRVAWIVTQKELQDYIRSMTQDELDDRVNWRTDNKHIMMQHSRWELLLYLAGTIQMRQTNILCALRNHFKMAATDPDMMSYLMYQDGSPEYFADLPAM